MEPEKKEDYKYGYIYNKKEDNRIFVPKGSGGIGWTLNFGNKLISY